MLNFDELLKHDLPSKAKATLAGIPGLHGYENALAVKKAYTSATKELDKIRNRQKEWDQKSVPEKQYLVIRSNKPEQRAERQCVLEQLDKKKREMEKRQRTKIVCKKMFTGKATVLCRRATVAFF